MYALIIVLLLQVQQNKQKGSVDFTAPQTKSVLSKEAERPMGQILTAPLKNTTPQLTVESAMMAVYGIGVDIGGQRQSIYELQTKVSGLENNREKVDRPDIESLKSTRTHIGWTTSILGTVLATVFGLAWGFRKVIWQDSIKPRLRKELTFYGL